MLPEEIICYPYGFRFVSIIVSSQNHVWFVLFRHAVILITRRCIVYGKTNTIDNDIVLVQVDPYS